MGHKMHYASDKKLTKHSIEQLCGIVPYNVLSYSIAQFKYVI